MNNVNKIVILGSGNLATHVSIAFAKAGLSVSQVYSRNSSRALQLATEIGCAYTSDVQAIYDADVYFFAVSDTAIAGVLEQRSWNNKTLIHCSGSVSMHIFNPHSVNYGVFYPFQTFTKGIALNLSSVPIFLEASNDLVHGQLEQLAESISSSIHWLHSGQRAHLHLAGIFANNFANYMLTVASQILEKEAIPPAYLNALVHETFRKAIANGSEQSQTGPAIRNNSDTVHKHVEMLDANPDWQKIYTFVSNSITDYYNNKNGKL